VVKLAFGGLGLWCDRFAIAPDMLFCFLGRWGLEVGGWVALRSPILRGWGGYFRDTELVNKSFFGSFFQKRSDSLLGGVLAIGGRGLIGKNMLLA
jgi:hypothetical protein